MVSSNAEDFSITYSKYNPGICWKTINTLELTSCPSLNGSDEPSFLADEVIFMFWKDS
jgi:hypothetical protein